MKCRTSSDCCGVNALCKSNRQTNFKHCRSTAASADEKGDIVNWGLCKSDTDCKPTDRCNTNNGVCFTLLRKNLQAATINPKTKRGPVAEKPNLQRTRTKVQKKRCRESPSPSRRQKVKQKIQVHRHQVMQR